MDNPLLEHLRATRQTGSNTRKARPATQQGHAAEHDTHDDGDGQRVPQRSTGTDASMQPPTPIAARGGTIAEQRIRVGMKDGMFENLPGAGKPLDLSDDAHIPSDMRLAFRLTKGQALSAPWVDAQREYEHERDRYRLWRTNISQRWNHIGAEEQSQFLAELPGRIAAVNQLVQNVNAMVPTDNLRVELLWIERETKQLKGQ